MSDLVTPSSADPAAIERSREPSGSAMPAVTRISDADAWVIVVIPLVAALLGVLLNAAGTGGPTSDNLGSMSYGGALLYFGFHDSARIKRAAANPGHVWLKWWALLTPIYLIQRARALRRGWMFFILFMAAVAVNVAVTVPSLFSPTTYWGDGLPRCEETFSINIIKSIFDDAVKKTGDTTTSIDQARETKLEGKVRSCSAIARFSDGSTRPMHYTISEEGHQFMFKAWSD